MRKASLLIGWTICLALHSVLGSAQSAPRIDLRIAEGKLTLRTEDVALSAVLQQIAQALGARLSISANAGARIGRWDLQQVPIEEAIAQITSGCNVAVVLDRQSSDEATLFVREIYLLSDSALDPKPPVRIAPAPPTGELTRTLGSADSPEARRAAAAELGTIGDAESVVALDKALGDLDPRVRLEVVESLGRIGTDEAIRLVAQAAMGSRDANVTAAAKRVLQASTSSLASVLLSGITSRNANPSSPN